MTAFRRRRRSTPPIVVVALVAGAGGAAAAPVNAQASQWETTAYGIVTDEFQTPVPGATVVIHVFDPATRPGAGAPGDSIAGCAGARVGGAVATSRADGTFARRLEARAASPPTACLRLDVKAPPRAAVTGLTLTAARVEFGAPRAGPTADSVRLVILLPWRGAEPPTVDPHPTPFASAAEELAFLAANVPGFGGYYVHGRDVTVYLLDISTASAVNPLLLAHFRRHPPKGLDPASLRLGYQPGRYTYDQLAGWRDELARTRMRGVVGIALRMDWNRVQVMVRGAQAARRVRETLEHLRIPAGAVMVVSPPSN